MESAGGVVLAVATVIALILANSPWADAYAAFWKTPVSFGVGSLEMSHSLKHWINDGLMGIFFFVMGLEVKRELVLGELRDLRRAALPIAAALGGMIVPAGLYLATQAGEPAARGWGIPMATDIAFVVGCLALLGSRVPASLRVLLVSLAIADDIGAILVIAIGYTDRIDLFALGLAIAVIATVRVLALAGVRSVGVYVFLGGIVWLEFHESGIHATIAGVILGLMTPAREWVSASLLHDTLDRAGAFLRGSGWTQARMQVARQVETTMRESISPLERLEAALHPWVSFGIMPVFALANAGVAFDLDALRDPVAASVGLGLVVGKPLGIVSFSAAAVALGLAQRPKEISWSLILAAGCLAGIGFTMSLFISGLALDGPALDAAKIGVLVASAVSGALGMALLAWRLPKAVSDQPPMTQD